jgi:hypothetical protein
MAFRFYRQFSAPPSVSPLADVSQITQRPNSSQISHQQIGVVFDTAALNHIAAPLDFDANGQPSCLLRRTIGS